MRSGGYGDGDVRFGRQSSGPALKSSYYFSCSKTRQVKARERPRFGEANEGGEFPKDGRVWL